MLMLIGGIASLPGAWVTGTLHNVHHRRLSGFVRGGQIRRRDRHIRPWFCTATPWSATSICWPDSVGFTIASVNVFRSAVSAATASSGYVSLPAGVLDLSTPTVPFTSWGGEFPYTASGMVPKCRRYNSNISPIGRTVASVLLIASSSGAPVYAEMTNRCECRSISFIASAQASD